MGEGKDQLAFLCLFANVSTHIAHVIPWLVSGNVHRPFCALKLILVEQMQGTDEGVDSICVPGKLCQLLVAVHQSRSSVCQRQQETAVRDVAFCLLSDTSVMFLITCAMWLLGNWAGR
jgi:hypothetical protein